MPCSELKLAFLKATNLQKIPPVCDTSLSMHEWIIWTSGDWSTVMGPKIVGDNNIMQYFSKPKFVATHGR